MESDEQLYEMAAKELANSPRQGLLIKCMANCEGNENKGKALYIKTRVNEIKSEIRERAKENKSVGKAPSLKEEFSDLRISNKKAFLAYLGVIALVFIFFYAIK
jgi:hypothetical protein